MPFSLITLLLEIYAAIYYCRRRHTPFAMPAIRRHDAAAISLFFIILLTTRHVVYDAAD